MAALCVISLSAIALSAGCSGSGDESDTGASSNQATVTNRIAVVSSGGEVYLINADGSDKLSLAGDGKPNGLAPVWSPDGTRIAFSEVTSAANAIVTANPDGTDQQRASTPFAGYFGYWDPTSARVGFLGNAPPGTGLVIDEGDGDSLDQVIDSDTFYFFSWSPDGSRWVVHSGSGLHIMNLDGTRTEIDLPDARFRAPVWAPNGDILLAIESAGRSVIVRFDPDTEEVEELLEVGRFANFALDPTGNLLAVETAEVEIGADPNTGVRAVSQTSGLFTGVLVYDLRTGSIERVVEGGIGAAWWSPDGTTLALLVPEDRAEPQFAQWLVWSRDGSFRTDRFLPARSFVINYAPFYDQFAQSVSPWAPDGSRFVYTGTDLDGADGVFVQPAAEDTRAVLIAEGDAVAFWSPN